MLVEIETSYFFTHLIIPSMIDVLHFKKLSG